MIDGIPARVSEANSITPTSLRLVAYSFRYTAVPTPRGSTMTRVISTMYTVFRMFGRIPMTPFRRLGLELRNFQLMFGNTAVADISDQPRYQRQDQDEGNVHQDVDNFNFYSSG